MTQNRATSDTKCHFLAIPLELRLMIYEYYLSTLPKWKRSELKRISKGKRRAFRPALLNTCIMIRSEGVLIYRKHLETLDSAEKGRFEAGRRAGSANMSAANQLYIHGLEAREKKVWQLYDAAFSTEIKKCEELCSLEKV